MKLPPYSTFPTILGERIILRQIQPSDLPSLLEISYYDALQASDIEEAAAMQEKIHRDYEKGHSIHWGIADKRT
ncbi:MAG: GNAT family N-acetyltransferase [Kaistella sp.]|nr:GNAT family N-acetyltransferase [Kaistella sp.]